MNLLFILLLLFLIIYWIKLGYDFGKTINQRENDKKVWSLLAGIMNDTRIIPSLNLTLNDKTEKECWEFGKQIGEKICKKKI